MTPNKQQAKKQQNKKYQSLQNNENLDRQVQKNKEKKIMQEEVRVLEREGSQLVLSVWLRLQTCLSKTQRTRVMRGFNIKSGEDCVLKIVSIHKRLIGEYKKVLSNAQNYYRRTKRSAQDLIIASDKICAIINQANLPPHSEPSQQQVHLQFTRPYLAGRNMHQQVYVHKQFSFDDDELAVFIKYLIDMLNTNSEEPTFIPSLDNIYFDGLEIVGNCTSFDTLMFLKHVNQHLSTQNFKQLYFLLPSDPRTFCYWQNEEQDDMTGMQNQGFDNSQNSKKKRLSRDFQPMRFYLLQRIKVKAMFVMLFCFMTYRSPIQMIIGEKISEQYLEWSQLIDPSTKSINERNKVIELIKQLPLRWKNYLNRPQNRLCLQQASLRFFKHFKQIDPLIQRLYTNQQLEFQKNFFFSIFEQVFVEEKKVRWRDFLDMNFEEDKQKNKFEYGWFLRRYIVQAAKEPQTIKKQKKKFQDEPRLLEQLINKRRGTRQTNSPPDPYQTKKQTAKKAFIYLHKYFLVQDITSRAGLLNNKERARQYVQSLHFQTYLPFKLGLPLRITLDYEDWFESFFVQNQDHHAEIYVAANKLNILLNQQAAHMIQTVTGFELVHLKRIQWLAGEKLAQNNAHPKIRQLLSREIAHQIQQKRPYEQSLWSFGLELRNISEDDKMPLYSIFKGAIKQYLDDSRTYSDLYALLIVYWKLQEEVTKSTTDQGLTESQLHVRISQELGAEKFRQLQIRLNQIRGSTPITQQFMLQLSKIRLQLSRQQSS